MLQAVVQDVHFTRTTGSRTGFYGRTDTLGRMHSDAQFAGSSSVPAHVEMMGLIGAGNNPMVGMTVAVAVSIEEAAKEGNSKICKNLDFMGFQVVVWLGKLFVSARHVSHT
ncbi:MAG: GGGtGRT protein [Anaerobutyricum sp.]